MVDLIVVPRAEIRLRVNELTIRNPVAPTPKALTWTVQGMPLKADGTYGARPAVSDGLDEPVTAEMLAITPPPGTIVEIAPGMNIDISGIPCAVVQAWIQWRGEQICDDLRPKIDALLNPT